LEALPERRLFKNRVGGGPTWRQGEGDRLSLKGGGERTGGGGTVRAEGWKNSGEEVTPSDWGDVQDVPRPTKKEGADAGSCASSKGKWYRKEWKEHPGKRGGL